MAHRFGPNPQLSKDAMTEAEVREVLARLAEERVSPSVKDVAAIAGASEADVRRVLSEVRAEQSPPETSVEPVAVSFLARRRVVVASIAVLVAIAFLSVFFTSASTRPPTVVETPPPPETATASATMSDSIAVTP